jgi:hypothetical protein
MTSLATYSFPPDNLFRNGPRSRSVSIWEPLNNSALLLQTQGWDTTHPSRLVGCVVGRDLHKNTLNEPFDR